MHFLKDPSLNLGKGITVLPKGFSDVNGLVLPKLRQGGFLLQEGVENPVLLKGFKFTFRLYLFVQKQQSALVEGKSSDYVLYLSTNGNTAASHTPYDTSLVSGFSGDVESAVGRAQLVTNQFTQLDVKQCGSGSGNGRGPGKDCCPLHNALPPSHRLWRHAEEMLVRQYGPVVMNRTEIRSDIKRILIAAVQPALRTVFTAEQVEVSNVLSNNSLPTGKSVLDICQALYGVDFILHHTDQKDSVGGGDGRGSVNVQLLEVQMEPNTLVKCPVDEHLYADLAAGVWQIVTNGRPHDNQIFEKLDFDHERSA